MFRRYDYTPHRRILYALMWAIAVAELGLTGARIHFTTKHLGGTHGKRSPPIPRKVNPSRRLTPHLSHRSHRR